MRAPRARPAWIGCCALALGLLAGTARADDIHECNAAYVQTQRLWRSGKLKSARLAALTCARDACSVTVRRDCGAWLADIDEATPSIVIEARDAAGNELAEVRTFVDGQLLAEHLDGQALRLDPGAHELRFEHEGKVQTQRLLALEGQAYRRVSVWFGPAEGASGGAPPSGGALPSAGALPAAAALPVAGQPDPPRAAAPPRGTSVFDRPVPLSSYVLGGVGAASLSAFAVLATSAYISERDLRDECGRACDKARVDALHDRYVMADVALAVGFSSLVAAGALWVLAPTGSAPEPPRRGVHVDWSASRVALSGSF